MKRLTTVMGRQHRFWWISKEGRGLTGKIEAHRRARCSGQFAMKTLFSHKGTGWTIARNFELAPVFRIPQLSPCP
jgi:hypothetical protein